MLEICPKVDFYISPTLSILNAFHITEFHKSWVDQGLIAPQDINVNILQDPLHYRIDVATSDMKNDLKQQWQEHLVWLEGSAIAFMEHTDNSHMIPVFWKKTRELDSVRNENILDYLPELARMDRDSAS